MCFHSDKSLNVIGGKAATTIYFYIDIVKLIVTESDFETLLRFGVILSTST